MYQNQGQPFNPGMPQVVNGQQSAYPMLATPPYTMVAPAQQQGSQSAYPMQAQPMPQFYMPNDAATAAQYEQSAKNSEGQKSFATYLKIPGPNGSTKWDRSVPKGYTNAVCLQILPPWGADKPIFWEAKTHFFHTQSKPKGTVLSYSGEDSLFMQAVRLGLQHPDKRIQDLANKHGRPRSQFLYNSLDLSNPSTHYDKNGVMRPLILSVGSIVQNRLKTITETRGGISKLVHPINGRPLRYTKKKTGSEDMNVEYDLLDLDPQPLDPYFYPALENLWDLSKEFQPATDNEMIQIIQELGLPMPATGQAFAQVPQQYQQQQGYNPNPQPQWGNPYQQPQAPQAPMQQNYMGGMAPPVMAAQPQAPVYQQPMQYQPQQMPQPTYQAPQAPMPQQNMQHPMLQNMPPMTMNAPIPQPPVLNPPPITSTGINTLPPMPQQSEGALPPNPLDSLGPLPF